MADPSGTSELPSFAFLFDENAWRLQGLRSWPDISLLGRANLDRLLELARERAAGAMHRGSLDRQELAALGPGLRRLELLARDTLERKPVLPRLRVEHFRRDDALEIFVGDSPGTVAGTSWVEARVMAVTKAHNPAWVTSEPNSGYFWQITARVERELFPGTDLVRFSTSEARALLAEEVRQLREEVAASTAFSALWCENAWRDWTPLWCLERGMRIDPSGVDFARWLRCGHVRIHS
jgi:hypothetical protein